MVGVVVIVWVKGRRAVAEWRCGKYVCIQGCVDVLSGLNPASEWIETGDQG